MYTHIYIIKMNIFYHANNIHYRSSRLFAKDKGDWVLISLYS